MGNSLKIPATTAQKQKEIEKLSPLEVFALDAYIISKLKNTDKLIFAYELSRPKETTANRQSLYMQARKWINSPKCKFYIEDRKKELFTFENRNRTGTETTEQTTGTTNPIYKRTKTETIEELNELATKTTDAKLKAEILLKLSDLEGWKKEIEKTDDNTIRYYLPLSCNVCELYKSAKLTKG